MTHPTIVAPLAAGLESGTPFIAYEYVAAESLDVVLRRAARPVEGLQWIAALADAVDAAHALGLVHGALHLRDVLVSSEGVCATGFGISSALEHVQLGLPVRRPYTAPEVMLGRRWGPPADRYALAVLAYELLTGTRPSASGDDAIADLIELRPDIADPAGLQQAFRNALAEDPGIRSASAAGFVAALVRVIGDQAYESPPPVAPAEVGADAAGLAEESEPERPGAQVEEDGYGDAAASGSPGVMAGSEGVAARSVSPPVQVALPDAVFGLTMQDAGARTAGDDDRGSRGPRSRRPTPSKRRPQHRSEAARHSGPVVAVRDEVRWDPLDEPSAAQPPVPAPAYGDDDVPPPPSPTSMRAVAPVIAAVAVGVVLAYLVHTGLRTSGDEGVGVASPPTERAGVGVEWSEQTLAGPGGAEPSTVPRAPQTLADEPVVPVGDPPLAGGGEAPLPRPVDPDPPGQRPPVPGARVESGAVESGAPAPIPEVPGAVSDTAPPAAEPTPEVAAGSLYVDSRPTGAAVSVDDVVVGVTPVEVPDVAFGARGVRIQMPGYRPWVTDVDVSGTEQVRIGARLEPEGRR